VGIISKTHEIRVPIERTSIPVDGSEIRRENQLPGKVVHPRVLAPSKRGLASERPRLVTMKLYVCQMPSTQFTGKMSFQDWGWMVAS